ncbi:MBOAT, membrane-bound O-acyltransferase family-domain-containing protein [Phyllosticta citrichinensis]|uniref:MBOAT, membrane-bound O-acyltransferase family-domain-containing protein n=1 Tax=Phyllosticta citrichinensis TaxID=1130410 RepID=A0ABR1XHP1_9PEZI
MTPQTSSQASSVFATRPALRASTAPSDTPPLPQDPSDTEDYDDLRDDASAFAQGRPQPNGHSTPGQVTTGSSAGSVSGGDSPHHRTYDDVRPPSLDDASSSHNRRRSVLVNLERTQKKGGYILTADDPEIRRLLRRGIERENSSNDSSAKASSRARFRDLVFTRQFSTFDRQNSHSHDSTFRGFFTLFWLAMALLLIRIAARNWRTYGTVFGANEIWKMMFERDVAVLLATDGVMVAVTVFGLFLHKLILKGYLSWERSGYLIEHAWQLSFLATTLYWTVYREWPWTHTIFLVLHCMVFLMKQHSYTFYNGYLSQIYRRKLLLEEKLRELKDKAPAGDFDSPVTSSVEKPAQSDLRRRRRSSTSKASTNLLQEKSAISSIAAAIASGEALDAEQLEAFTRVIEDEVESLQTELRGKATKDENAYPNNLTLANFADWTVLPTLVYELEYPRQEKINWWYVAEKTTATFGVIWVMMVISQAYIYPPVTETLRMKEAGMPLLERAREFPWIVSDIMFPMLLEQLLAWYVIWECALNVLAELSRFADRGFYGDWWNSTSWDQYARNWNRPVHVFLLRHVYHSSISSWHLSKGSATFVTFLLSALVHELVMLCLFKKVRGYLFALQLSQIPLVSLSRTRLLKGRALLGNIIFWIGLFVGPSLLTSLYLIV